MRKHAQKGRPSPAIIISILALFVGLSGTAVAASQINGKDIKPKSIHGSKLQPFTGGLLKQGTVHGSKLKPFTGGLIKAGSIPAGKIASNSLGGNQIDESRLGPVPSAERLAGSFQGKVAFGGSIELAKSGPFTVTGTCLQNAATDDGTGGRDIARILISTTETGAVLSSGIDSLSGNGTDQYLTPETAEADRVVSEVWTATGNANYKTGGEFSAMAPSGAGMVSPAGSNSAAINQFGTGCVFQGAVQVTG